MEAIPGFRDFLVAESIDMPFSVNQYPPYSGGKVNGSFFRKTVLGLLQVFPDFIHKRVFGNRGICRQFTAGKIIFLVGKYLRFYPVLDFYDNNVKNQDQSPVQYDVPGRFRPQPAGYEISRYYGEYEKQDHGNIAFMKKPGYQFCPATGAHKRIFRLVEILLRQFIIVEFFFAMRADHI